MGKITVAPGARFGRWTVLSLCEGTEGMDERWHCRCDCGTERDVLARSLRHGGTQSCGCLRRENLRQARAYELQGKVFGELTALHPADDQSKNGGIWWTCRCSCGGLYDCPATLLVTGRRTHCGCKTKHGRPMDIRGRRFYRLVAEEMLPERDGSGSVMWRCRCDCGNEITVSYNNLVYGNMRSCGCRKKEHDRKLNSFLTHVAGTSVDMLRSKKLPSDNTTGYRGVYLVRGRYLAKIVFQKKSYFLGSFDNIEDAAKTRREAEEMLFDGVAEHYARWKELADLDPEWAAENPVDVIVTQVDRKLSVTLLPELPAPVRESAAEGRAVAAARTL